jgi:hypothetical protein
MIIPDGGKAIRSYSISSVRFYTTISAAAGLFCLSLLVGFAGLGARVDSVQLDRLSDENVALRQEIRGMEDQVAELSDRMNVAISSDEQLRLAAGLDPITPDVWEMGIGGPGYDASEGSFDYVNDKDASVLRKLDSQMGKLLRQTELQKESYNEVLKVLREEQELARTTPSIRPVAGGYYSSGFGDRVDPFTGKKKLHPGLDICVPVGTDVCVTADGIVSSAGYRVGFGRTIEVDHGNGLSTVYAHNSKLLVGRRERVARGQVIALSGNSGRSTAPHLHYEVRRNGAPINPINYIRPEDVIVQELIEWYTRPVCSCFPVLL